MQFIDILLYLLLNCLEAEGCVKQRGCYDLVCADILKPGFITISSALSEEHPM
jgi:hypothetical protein